jgi:hypothetical protein
VVIFIFCDDYFGGWIEYIGFGGGCDYIGLNSVEGWSNAVACLIFLVGELVCGSGRRGKGQSENGE